MIVSHKRVPQVVFQNLLDDRIEKLKQTMKEFYEAMNNLAETKSKMKDNYFCQKYNEEDLLNLNELKRDFQEDENDVQIDSSIEIHQKIRSELETEEKVVWSEYQDRFEKYKVQKRA